MKCLNLGSGNKRYKDYTSCDLFPGKEVDEVFPLQKIPYPDNSIDCLHSEHALEHLGYMEARQALKEWARVLKPGGTLHLMIPDLEVCCRRFVESKTKQSREWWRKTIYGAQKSQADEPDEAQRHLTGFTMDEIKEELELVGFQVNSCHRYGDYIDGEMLSIEVDAVKMNKPAYQERPCEAQPGDIQNAKNRYHLAAAFCKGKRVLDYSCGEGYGTEVLRTMGIDVLGIEPYPGVIARAQEKFPLCRFTLAPLYIEAQFDIVVALEVIEHMEVNELDDFLKTMSDRIPEIVASTPNGNMFAYNPATKEQRVGYHVRHYTWTELHELFSKYYKYVEVFGLAFDPNPKVSRYTGHMIYASN